MGKLFFVLGAIVLIFFVTIDVYVGGRIMLPAMGLKAVEFWTCFWFVTWSVVFSTPLLWLAAALKN